MNCIDFEYNGRKLSDYGCVICNILNNNSPEENDIGNQISFNTINYNNENNSNKFKLLNSSYDSQYSTHIEICKNYCKDDDKYFTDTEIIKIMRWLNQKKFHKFKMIYSDGQYHNIYYNGSFNVKLILYSGMVIGMSLDFTSDAPFGYYEPISHYMDFSVEYPQYGEEETEYVDNLLGEYILYDQSDEAGYIYPDEVEIEIIDSGNLVIHNSMDMEDVVINNCVSGEIITLDCKHKLIKSSIEHKNLYNDFNYHFLKIINNYDECDENDSFSKNIYTVSLKCIISFSYSPIAKIGVV